MVVLYPILSLGLLIGGSLIVPLLGFLGKKIGLKKIREIYVFILFLVSTILLFYTALYEKLPTIYRIIPMNIYFESSLMVDYFSIYMSLIFCFLGLMVSLYSIKYMERETGLDEYYVLLLILVGGMVGVTFSNDFFTLYVFWEFMCIASYTLVSFRKYHWEAVEAGLKYLIMSTTGSLLALYSISLLYGITGTLCFDELSKIILSSVGTISPHTLYFIIAIMLSGFGVTAAIVPFHTWLPDAHPAAPSSISAMLSGVVIKTAIYVIIRTLFKVFLPTNFGYGLILLFFGIITMTIANIAVITQKDIKRFLAYSSIANIGYIITGLGIATYILYNYSNMSGFAGLALLGSLLHILNHAIGKGLLFLTAGSFIHELKTRLIDKLEGIGLKMPFSSTSFSIGLLNLAGMPPLSGFWSKFFIISAGLSVRDNILFITTVIFIVNSIVAAGYYSWLLERIIFKKSSSNNKKIKDVSIYMILPEVILALLCILITIFLHPVLVFINKSINILIGV